MKKASLKQHLTSLKLHEKFNELESAIANGATQKDQLLRLRTELKQEPLHDEARTVIKCSCPTLERKLSKWRKGGRIAEALLPDYGKQATNRIPDLLINEYQRLCTRPMGGKNKHGAAPCSIAYNQLKKDWKDGKSIPGLGTWTEWWMKNEETAKFVLPTAAPEFPYTERGMRRHQPVKAVAARGNVGAVAAKNHEAFIERDYSLLRKGELYTLDDARVDVVAINELTGKVEEVGIYVFMEVASRAIVGFVCKPKHAIIQEDVDELIAHSLQTGGYGIGVGYVTHILFERGTIACSPAAQTVLEGGSNNGIKVIRTGLNEGVRWVGAAPDRAKGNAQGKAVVESFFRRLHHELSLLPGQRGNNWNNAPENLGFGRNNDAYRPFLDEEKEAARELKSSSQVANRLAQFNRRAAASGATEKLELPFLTFNQIRVAIRKAIDFLNNDRGHAYQGHHQIEQVETAPGIWQDTTNN